MPTFNSVCGAQLLDVGERLVLERRSEKLWCLLMKRKQFWLICNLSLECRRPSSAVVLRCGHIYIRHCHWFPKCGLFTSLYLTPSFNVTDNARCPVPSIFLLSIVLGANYALSIVVIVVPRSFRISHHQCPLKKMLSFKFRCELPMRL